MDIQLIGCRQDGSEPDLVLTMVVEGLMATIRFEEHGDSDVWVEARMPQELFAKVAFQQMVSLRYRVDPATGLLDDDSGIEIAEPDDGHLPAGGPPKGRPTIEAIRSVIDIVGLVGEYLPLDFDDDTETYRSPCPFHEDTDANLIVDGNAQTFRCDICEVRGDLFDFVKLFEHLDFVEALRRVADRAGVSLEKDPA